MVMPKGAITITGIATRYNNTWQILIRKTSDIKY
jgi:DNA/RNA endonuclease YhcR with UshA esterase domain